MASSTSAKRPGSARARAPASTPAPAPSSPRKAAAAKAVRPLPAKAKAATTAGPAAAPAAPAAPKAPKQKLVRDSFTIPRGEYQQIEALKQRLVTLMRPTKKSELLRAGIKLLASLPDDALKTAVEAGRPGKSKSG
jgi:hypothetical protein